MTQQEQDYARRLMQAGTVDTAGDHDGPYPPSAAPVAPPEPEAPQEACS